ncbi:MAG: hypothetical protein AAF434_17280 [Pseudomonadota bacterium]
MNDHKLRIGNNLYSVEAMQKSHSDDSAMWGVTRPDSKEIGILVDGAPLGILLNTYIHEPLHAICAEHRIDMPREQEERVVTSMADGIQQLIVDNPHYLDQLVKLVKEARKQLQ